MKKFSNVSPGQNKVQFQPSVPVTGPEDVRVKEILLKESAGVKNKVVQAMQDIDPAKELSPEEQTTLLSTLKSRFEKNKKLHPKLSWVDVDKALKADPEKLWSLQQLENTGGEPDVFAPKGDETDFLFVDCSKESPDKRRNVVFDRESEDFLQKNYPQEICNGNAVDKAEAMGVDLMDESQWDALRKKLFIDENTWSWLKTPSDVRKTGCALCGDRTDMYQDNANFRGNSRGFRCALRVKKVA